MATDRLAVDRRGRGPRLVLVHGFTQTGRSWDPVVDHLGDRFELVAVDAPGHGGSADVRADLGETAELLAEAGDTATYVGYSMGGRMCLHVAVARPDVVERLVLVSATAGIDDAGDRASRRASDEQLAASIERAGVDTFLERWLAQPLFAGLDAPDLEDRRRNTAAGLATSLRLAGAGTQRPLWDDLAEVRAPVLLIAGSRDAKFVAAAERMAGLLPHATVEVVDGAGHAVHLERPAAVLAVLDRWLATTP